MHLETSLCTTYNRQLSKEKQNYFALVGLVTQQKQFVNLTSYLSFMTNNSICDASSELR